MNVSLRFLYIYCNDLMPVRHFYSELIGLEEMHFSAGEAVAYRCDQLQFTIFQADHPLPAVTGWASQPGWAGGTRLDPSWSVECSKAAFDGAVRRLSEAGAPAYREAPVWVGYWSFPIRDPMGYTVELTCPSDGPDEPGGVA
jgi:hypothetical protein